MISGTIKARQTFKSVRLPGAKFGSRSYICRIVTEARRLPECQGVEELRLTEIQYAIANETQSFAARAFVMRYCFVCLVGHSVECRWINDRVGSAHQNLRKIKWPFELVSDDALQCSYDVRSQQVGHIDWWFREHFLPYLRGCIVF